MGNNLPVLPQVLGPLLHPTCCSTTAGEEVVQAGRDAFLERVAQSGQLRRN